MFQSLYNLQFRIHIVEYLEGGVRGVRPPPPRPLARCRLTANSYSSQSAVNSMQLLQISLNLNLTLDLINDHLPNHSNGQGCMAYCRLFTISKTAGDNATARYQVVVHYHAPSPFQNPRFATAYFIVFLVKKLAFMLRLCS